MSLTLPIEEMSRMQVTLKVTLPDGRLVFDMKPASNSSISSIQLSGLKLHFQGAHDEHGLSLCVWASGTSQSACGAELTGQDVPEDCKIHVPRVGLTY